MAEPNPHSRTEEDPADGETTQAVAPAARASGPTSLTAAGRPFATLEGARDAVRELKATAGRPVGGLRVRVRSGVHALARGVRFGPEDSGTAAAPIVYCAAEGETVRLLGGRQLDPAAWTPVIDPAVRARLAGAAKEHVVQIDLAAQGVTDLGSFVSRGFGRDTAPAHLELFFNDLPMIVAQWPNAGQFAEITGFTKPMSNAWGQEAGDLTGGFTYDGDRPSRWVPADDIWVHGYWGYDWANSYERVSRLDPENRVVKTAPPHGNYHFTPGQRFYFLNVLEELDQPGEYCVDQANGILYFWPPGPLSGAEAVVSEVREPLLTLQNVSHVELRGLTVEAGRGSGIEAEGGEGLRIIGCTIRNCGTWAVRIQGGTNHTVAGCDIYGSGGRRHQRQRRRPPQSVPLQPCHRQQPHPPLCALEPLLCCRHRGRRGRHALRPQPDPRRAAQRHPVLGQRVPDREQRDLPGLPGDRGRRGHLHRPRLHLPGQRHPPQLHPPHGRCRHGHHGHLHG